MNVRRTGNNYGCFASELKPLLPSLFGSARTREAASEQVLTCFVQVLKNGK